MWQAFSLKLAWRDLVTLSMRQSLCLLVMAIAVLLPAMVDGSLFAPDRWVILYQLAGLSGIICVYLINLRKLSNFLYGLINAVIYGVAAYHARYYGDALLNFCVYLPFQLVGAMLWSRKMQDDGVRITGMSYRSRLLWIAVVVLGTLLVGYLLGRFSDDPMPYVDASTNWLSVVAMVLMVRGFWENWLGWDLVNGLSVWMWFSAGQFEPAAYAVLVMWLVYLGNSLYGTVNWYRSQSHRRINSSMN